MKTLVKYSGVVVLFSVALFTLNGCSSDNLTDKASSLTMIQPGEAGGAMMDTYEQTATVTSIDPVTRDISMVTPDGEMVNFKAGPEVVNFDQIEVGDQVNAILVEQFVVFARKPGEAAGDGADSVFIRAPQGEKPAVMLAHTEEVTAQVKSINMKRRKATLLFPDGTKKTFKVRDDVDLTKYAVGDEIVIRATESMAVSVEKP